MSNVMDDCYGKQIDFYNQMPNSVYVIEDLMRRLEESEKKGKELIDFSFRTMSEFTVRGEITWSKLEIQDVSSAHTTWLSPGPSVGEGDPVEVNVIFEKEIDQITLKICDILEYVANPDDYEHLKPRGINDSDSMVVAVDREDFDTDAIIDIHGEFKVYKRRYNSTDPEYHYLEFSNKAQNAKKRITYIRFERRNPLLDFLRYKKDE